MKHNSLQRGKATSGIAYSSVLERCPPTKVWLELSAIAKEPQRIEIELYCDESPRICENFRMLCTGEQGILPRPINGNNSIELCFKGTTFHRIEKGFIVQGGDVCHTKGETNSFSAFGRHIPDENMKRSHNQPGCVSMANTGANTNGTQFFITLSGDSAEALDGKHCCFGQVVDGLDWLLATVQEQAVSDTGRPKYPIVISDCGVISQ